MSTGRKAVVKVEKRSGRIVERYESVSEAAEATGYRKSSLSHACATRALAEGPYYYRFEDDYERFEDISHKKNSPVICNGTFYNTLKEAADAEDIDYSFLARLLKGYAKHNQIRIWWA